MALHDVHCRRRQVLFERFCPRLLVTAVREPQYMQTMSTYCHNAGQNASG